MAGNGGGFEDDPMAPGCYSQLLFGDEISGLETDGCFGFTSSSFSHNDDGNNNDDLSVNIVDTPKMLCFGDYAKECDVKVANIENVKKMGRKSGPGPACKDDSSLASTNNAKISSLPKSNKKRNGSDIQNPVWLEGSQSNSKKPKSNNSTASGHAKVVKKEKLGDRITALQQLVSPFGKTDTASVLHEAFGYIRFLQDQVQVLCSPYLQRWSTSKEESQLPDEGESTESKKTKNDLRSRGLCLVPVELTLHVADSNGADLWSSAAMLDTLSTG